MADVRIGVRADVNGFDKVGQAGASLADLAEKNKALADMNKYQQTVNDEATRRFLENEKAKQSIMNSQTVQGGAYRQSALNAYQNSGYGANPAALANSPANATAKSIDQKIGELSKVLDKLYDELGEVMDKGVGVDKYRATNNLSETIQQVESEKRRLEAEKAKSERENEGFDKLKKWLSFDKFAQAANNIGNVAQAEFTYEADVANGNVVGAQRRRNTAIAGTVGNTLTTVGTGVAALGGPIGWAIGGVLALAGIGTNFVSRMVEGKGAAEDAQAAAYMGNFDSKYGAARLFGNMSGSVAGNTNYANDIYARAAAAAKDTGLSTNDFLQIMTQAATYGVSENVASQMARQAGLWTQATGADTNALMKLQGTAERYGLGSDSIGWAYGGLLASGMQKGQFNEFLNGLQTVIENGISNGYVSSVEEVSQNLTMFARLSGDNPLWQGQQGANRFNQMNSSLAQATNLQSTNDMIVYGALKTGGSYIDTMKAIERGLNDKDAFGKIFGSITRAEGGNYEAIIERLRGVYGLNYTQAEQVYRMGTNLGSYSESAYKAQMQDITGVKNEQTEWQNTLNDISLSMNAIGQGKWQDNLVEHNLII